MVEESTQYKWVNDNKSFNEFSCLWRLKSGKAQSGVGKQYVAGHDHKGQLTLVLLNKLRWLVHFWFSANQITWFWILIQIHILYDKQCRSRSIGFFRSQLIWIYTVCKGRVYQGSAGQGLRKVNAVLSTQGSRIHNSKKRGISFSFFSMKTLCPEHEKGLYGICGQNSISQLVHLCRLIWGHYAVCGQHRSWSSDLGLVVN